MIGEVILEKVPGLLTIYRVHGNQITRIHSISQELETHARSSVQCWWSGFLGQGESCPAIGGATIEETRVAVASKIFPLNLRQNVSEVWVKKI